MKEIEDLESEGEFKSLGSPKEFEAWFLKYRERASYLVATLGDEHGLWLCLRDAWISGMNSVKKSDH